MSLRTEIPAMVRLALPVVIAELGWMFMGVVDTMMVGRLGPTAIGAVSIGSVLFDLLAFTGLGLLLGLDTHISQSFGAGKLDECNRWLWQGLYLATAITPAMALIILALGPLIGRMGIVPEVAASAIPYLHTMMWSSWPLLLFLALRRYLQSMSVVRPVTVALVSANLVNAAGNWLLIYGNFGFPAMGVTGAGWATFGARVYLAGFLAAYIAVREFRNSTGLIAAWSAPHLGRLRDLLRLGLPAAGQITIEVSVFGAATLLAGRLDTASLAAHHIALNVVSTTFMVPLGVSSAGTIAVGQAIGRGDPRAARRAGWIALALGIAFMGCAGVYLLIAPQTILRLFTADPAVLAQGAILLVTAAIFQLFDGAQVIATGVLRGMGDTRTPMLTNLVGHWLLGFPVGYALGFPLRMGAPGIWAGLSLGLIVVGGFLVLVWMRRSNALLHVAELSVLDTKFSGSDANRSRHFSEQK